jgi:excisionase family DNA binding protein
MLNQPNEDRRPNQEGQEGDDDMTNLTKYVTTRKAAELLGVKQDHIRKLLGMDKIKGRRLGHDWIVFAPSLEKYLATKSKRGRPRSGTPTLKAEKRDGQE